MKNRALLRKNPTKETVLMYIMSYQHLIALRKKERPHYMNRAKIFKNIFIILILLSLFVSCKNKEEQTNISEPVTLIVESRLFSPPGEKQFILEEILPEFEAQHNCTVSFTTMDDDSLLKKAKFQKESGKVTTDVIIVHDGIMNEWIRNEYIIPLPVSQWSDRTFSIAFRFRISSGGETYFAPIGGDVYLTLINKRSLPYKPEGADPQALSWEEYVQWGRNIAEQTGSGRVGITGVPQKSLIYMYGGVFLSYGGEFPVINSEGAVKGWELMVQMKDAYNPDIFTYDNVSLPMKSEDIWMTVAHMVRLGEVYREHPERFILAPAPKGSKGIGTIAGASGFAVMKGAPHKDLALEFVKFMTEPSRAVKISQGTGGFIPLVNESLDLLGDSPEDEIIAQGIEMLKTAVVSGVPGGDYVSWGDVKQVYDDAFLELVMTRQEVDIEYLNAAQEKLNRMRRN